MGREVKCLSEAQQGDLSPGRVVRLRLAREYKNTFCDLLPWKLDACLQPAGATRHCVFTRSRVSSLSCDNSDFISRAHILIALNQECGIPNQQPVLVFSRDLLQLLLLMRICIVRPV